MNNTPVDINAQPPRIYEDVLQRAFRIAERHVAWDQALEIAHDVAIAMLSRSPEQVTGGFIYRSVVNRVRNLWRATQRRAAAEGVHHAEREEIAALDPATELEAQELQGVVELTLARMPHAMRETFALVREHELSYKEAAAHMNVAVGTVHAQLSRANALLREAIRQYERDNIRPKSRAGRNA